MTSLKNMGKIMKERLGVKDLKFIMLGFRVQTAGCTHAAKIQFSFKGTMVLFCG